MSYEEFLVVWNAALLESGLPVQGVSADTTLDLSKLDRRYEVRVEPLHGQDTPPFYVTALLSWRWSALATARTATSEEDMVRELLNRSTKTQRPWIRVDVKLHATLPMMEPMAMPTTATWRRWREEAMNRLEHIAPLLPDEVVREHRGGQLEILGWQGQPELEAGCRPDGTLVLGGVSLAAWQAVHPPRNSDTHKDRPPHAQLEELFSRLKAALHAWSESLDHLRPGK
jgi:hypothetical protein